MISELGPSTSLSKRSCQSVLLSCLLGFRVSEEEEEGEDDRRRRRLLFALRWSQRTGCRGQLYGRICPFEHSFYLPPAMMHWTARLKTSTVSTRWLPGRGGPKTAASKPTWLSHVHYTTCFRLHLEPVLRKPSSSLWFESKELKC